MIAEGEGRKSLQNPAFSPDGSKILYTCFEKGYNRGLSRLWIIPVTGGTPTQLTPDIAGDNNFMDVNLPGSCWNQATDRITFASDREDADEVWTMNSQGGDLLRITHHVNPPYYLEPSYFPDGAWIVFEIDCYHSSWEDGFRGDIWMVRSDGTGVVKLPGADSLDYRQPNWSPQGDLTLFQRRSLQDQEDWDIYTVTPNGDSLFNVTSSASSDTDASFSSDGSEIVYSSDYCGLEYPNLFIVSRYGGHASASYLFTRL